MNMVAYGEGKRDGFSLIRKTKMTKHAIRLNGKSCYLKCRVFPARNPKASVSSCPVGCKDLRGIHLLLSPVRFSCVDS